jgi:DNA-3-methyladenine glycosylase
VRLRRSFFARPALEVAPDLLGCTLVHQLNGTTLAGRIVEVEAYLPTGDEAAHSRCGPTARNGSMFGPPGRLYVYRSMGLHHCANVVCEEPGIGTGVLIRALEPREGLAEMRARRANRPDTELCNGPGKLCAAMALDLAHDGETLLTGALAIHASRTPIGPIHASPRIGISKAVDHPYRFFIAGHPCVTKAPQNGRARPQGRRPPTAPSEAIEPRQARARGRRSTQATTAASRAAASRTSETLRRAGACVAIERGVSRTVTDRGVR